jgi:hypothetical protein
MSRDVGVAVMHIWWLRIAQALGLPVVPEVKIKAERSRGVALAGGEMVDGVGSVDEVRRVMEASVGAGTLSNDPRLRVKCRLSPTTKLARSGVEMMELAVETSRQYFRVSSIHKLGLKSFNWVQDSPLRLILTNPATALNFDNARIVTYISGEFVV